jgi:FlaA1/EpsC-like NDP-sugar epimerase
MAESGDLFLLDMGTPSKIIDLAERLIRLSGKSVKKGPNNETTGDIEIKITGLRPGEKLHEELLVDADAQPTAHAKIMRAREQYVTLQTLEAGMQDLISHLNQSNTTQFKLTLAELVVGYKPSEPTQSV